MINGSFAIIQVNGKYPFIKREDNGLWEMPGGGYESSEYDYKKVLLREIEEETGIKLTPKQLQLCAILGQKLKKKVSEQHGGVQYGLAFLHCCILYEELPQIKLSDEHTDWRMFTYEEIINEWETFSSGPLWFFFTFLMYQQKKEVQEGTVFEKRFWQGKEYYKPLQT